jgi:hypothetical protein
VTVEEFIAKWKPSGGNERANTQLFINDLSVLLDVPTPEPTRSDTATNDYVFERHVVKTEIDGTSSNGWIDCYKRDCFILEAKQGSDRDRAAYEAGQGDSLRDFFGQTAADRFKRGMARRGTGQWTAAMQKAAGQAEGYAKALPKEHGWPPFLLVSDIGYCIDVYADFSRSGKGYAPYPDRRKYRIELDDLRDEKVRERLKAIWTGPMSLDPSAEAARVTREIAGHLATLARRLEAREQNPDRVAHFLMRLLFTMFAEDTSLIPRNSFSELLKKVRDRPENLIPQLSDLWAKMDKGGFVGALGEAGETVRRFNGYLFKETTALPLESEEIDVLIAAAASDWREVEPAIFGTLLERALNPKERAKLGAHYTPRAYVERLVQPTIMEPLKEDWLGARTAAMEAADQGKKDEARKIVEEYHGKLARTKVLDPACGTGNFLYVSMARMKELEGEVLELLEELGDKQYLAEISGHTITPENFLGIEINPRAAAIAQLVLWIGYLQWHFRVNGEDRMPEPPVLRDIQTIENRDALIDYDRKELEKDQNGRPVSRWDGETMKPHPVTGKAVPDETARLEVYRYVNPRPAKWPKADFIIGNPPFIGGKDVRERLGDGYFEALFRTTDVPESADFVMHWWDKASTRVRKNQTRRFGFVTTNSLPQTFSRRVVQKHLDAPNPLSLIFVIPDHPWVTEKGSAAVRIAFTVGASGNIAGRILRVDRESVAPELIDYVERTGTINADLTAGAAVAIATPLKAGRKICSPGVKLHGKGFLLTAAQVDALGAFSILKPFRNGRDLVDRPRGLYVIDTYGFSEHKLRSDFPLLFDHLYRTVKPERDSNRREYRRQNWWLFGENNPDFRAALAGLRRFVATPETSKHRLFQFLGDGILPDNTVTAVCSDDSYVLGVLSSRMHVLWALAAGGALGPTPRYNKTRCFDPFPFPDTSDEALKQRIRDAAEKLDALRKQVLERHPDLTLTKLYNVLEALRAAEGSGGVLGDKERDVAERGCVSLIRQYHDEIDAAVAEAYGWGDLVPLMQGPSTASRSPSPADAGEENAPSPSHSAEPSGSLPPPQRGEGLDELILERLVALNRERAAEEAKGKVRWLRPEYQAPGYVAPAEQATLALAEEERPTAEILEWPSKLPEQVVAVAGIVERAGRPIAANDVARAFKGKRAGTVAPVLDALAGMGRLRKLGDGRFAA